ncbi:MAG: SDR family NAD(P)-dependent oxidoreductase [Candidatus Polarisedimenticolia bacterium]
MMSGISGSVALVTGSSEGIGLSAARAYAAAGARVALTARTASRLHQEVASLVAGGADALAVPADVTSPDDVARLMHEVRERWGGLDILVCNAGVGLFGSIETLSEPALRQAFEVNFFGVVRCIQQALPLMRPRRRGLIQIVSSVIGRRSLPMYGGYCATKFALHAVADALRLELEPDGIQVQMFYPALTDTRFSRNALVSSPRTGSGRIRATSADEVARQMVAAARRRKRDHVVTAGGRALVRLNDLAPGLVDAILGQVMMRPGGRTKDPLDALSRRREQPRRRGA